MKQLLYFLLLLTFFTACKSSSPIITSKKVTAKKELQTKAEKKKITSKTNHLIEKLIDAASDNIGVKYRSGGTTKAGFDCSGLMYSVFSSYDIPIPRSSYEQSKVGLIIDRERDNVKKGDLIFFKTNRKSKINHVGLVVEIADEEVKFIHSSTSKGVIISSTKEPYYQNSFVQINRILR